MKLIVTLSDVFELVILGLFIIAAVFCILFSVIDVYTREWRYKHFRCPKCKRKNNCFRNYREECTHYERNISNRT